MAPRGHQNTAAQTHSRRIFTPALGVANNLMGQAGNVNATGVRRVCDIRARWRVWETNLFTVGRKVAQGGQIFQLF